MKYLDPQLCDLLAGEYVLGTLKGRARRRFEAILGARPDLRRRVREWEQRLVDVLGQVPETAPPASVWRGIEARLFADSPKTPWYERLSFWRALSIGSAGLAFVLALVLVLSPPTPAPGYVVMLNDHSAKPTWLISTAANMDQLYIKPLKRVNIPPDARCVLWLKPKGSDRTYPLGVLPDQGNDKMLPVDKDMRTLMPGRLLVTVEPMKNGLPNEPSSPPTYQGEWISMKRI